MQDQLKNVQQIPASGGTFAAILGDGTVVTWGDHGHGGDSTCAESATECAADPLRPFLTTDPS